MSEDGNRAYWALRIGESMLLLGMLAGIAMFGWSLIDIVRIETGTAGSTSLPPSAWPGVAVFGGSLVLLQIVRIALHRYRREDGTPRADARGSAAAATAEALTGLEANEAKSNTGDGA